jgi:hypothetical protein
VIRLLPYYEHASSDKGKYPKLTVTDSTSSIGLCHFFELNLPFTVTWGVSGRNAKKGLILKLNEQTFKVWYGRQQTNQLALHAARTSHITGLTQASNLPAEAPNLAPPKLEHLKTNCSVKCEEDA